MIESIESFNITTPSFDALIQTLYPMSIDFMKGLKAHGFLESSDPQEKTFDEIELNKSIETLCQHEFFIWLNKSLYFKQAKKMLTDNGLICDSLHMKSLFDYYSSILLEFTVANVIHSHFHNIELIKKSVVAQRKINQIKATASKLYNLIETVDGYAFKIASKQHFLQFLLGDLLKNSNESSFNSGKLHKDLAREFFIKRMIHQISSILFEENLTATFIADLAINIVNIFFENEADRNDCIAHVKRIRFDLEEEREFESLTVKQLMSRYAREKLKDKEILV